VTADSPPAVFGGQLDQALRRDLEEVAQSIPIDDGGGASILKTHEPLFSLSERKIFLWPAGGGSDFAVLRVRR